MPRTILATIAALMLCLAGCGSVDRSQAAYDACKKSVEDQLKAPGTASFESEDAASITVNGASVHVSAWVDSENGFGAKIRTRWECSTTVSDSGDASGAKASLL